MIWKHYFCFSKSPVIKTSFFQNSSAGVKAHWGFFIPLVAEDMIPSSGRKGWLAFHDGSKYQLPGGHTTGLCEGGKRLPRLNPGDTLHILRTTLKQTKGFRLTQVQTTCLCKCEGCFLSLVIAFQHFTVKSPTKTLSLKKKISWVFFKKLPFPVHKSRTMVVGSRWKDLIVFFFTFAQKRWKILKLDAV